MKHQLQSGASPERPIATINPNSDHMNQKSNLIHMSCEARVVAGMKMRADIGELIMVRSRRSGYVLTYIC